MVRGVNPVTFTCTMKRTGICVGFLYPRCTHQLHTGRSHVPSNQSVFRICLFIFILTFRSQRIDRAVCVTPPCAGTLPNICQYVIVYERYTMRVQNTCCIVQVLVTVYDMKTFDHWGTCCPVDCNWTYELVFCWLKKREMSFICHTQSRITTELVSIHKRACWRICRKRKVEEEEEVKKIGGMDYVMYTYNWPTKANVCSIVYFCCLLWLQFFFYKQVFKERYCTHCRDISIRPVSVSIWSKTLLFSRFIYNLTTFHIQFPLEQLTLGVS